jgi:hypothetical protein
MIASFDLTVFLVTNYYKEEYYDNYKKNYRNIRKKLEKHYKLNYIF